MSTPYVRLHHDVSGASQSMQAAFPGSVRRKVREDAGKEEDVGVLVEFIEFNCVGKLG